MNTLRKLGQSLYAVILDQCWKCYKGVVPTNTNICLSCGHNYSRRSRGRA